ncbi:oxygenase MpaB family protein [Nocardia bovistercoris]|uniref:DUF2236 domain-containing protein n=1 Tax=Nocardia bovistercoris TaxID=2785916 RepID=A0A931IA98_9NOCA|nr:oxygenase MpaB family protein [Nocardia bovistercoris]MBH0776760.1 DUF2236 domain-containing protein [Nocardia bovistercoris]
MSIEREHAVPPPQARDGDASLAARQRIQRPVPPDSLTWKYFGDRRSLLLIGRAGTTENMYPQLGQAVSDHSVIFTDLFARVRRSVPRIMRVVYGDDGATTGVQIRNFHKPLRGTMADGSKFDGQPYSGLDPETFYWAHATFLDVLFLTCERFIRPLSDDEKEQLFQESRDWYSLYGMDATGTPATYREFEEYWRRVVAEDLVGHTKVARYTVGYITKGISRAVPRPRAVPKPLWTKIFAPALDTVAAFLGAGGLDPALRDRLGIPWTDRKDRRYRRFCAAVRAIGPAWERLAPLTWRYDPAAVAGFQREGVDPRRIRPRKALPTT